MGGYLQDSKDRQRVASLCSGRRWRTHCA